jgi:hypothetical protein
MYWSPAVRATSGASAPPCSGEQGYRVTVIDDLSTGNREAVPSGAAAFLEGDVLDRAPEALQDGCARSLPLRREVTGR